MATVRPLVFDIEGRILFHDFSIVLGDCFAWGATEQLDQIVGKGGFMFGIAPTPGATFYLKEVPQRWLFEGIEVDVEFGTSEEDAPPG